MFFFIEKNKKINKKTKKVFIYIYIKKGYVSRILHE
jgi:hypothetical protein